MANSKFEYVRTFETPDSLLPSTYIVIRIDGRGFHKLSAKYAWTKPNDRRAIDLSNAAAQAVMREIHDLVVAYGQSDEYSFVFPPSSTLFDRRASKLVSTVVSTYTAYYTHLWPTFFPTVPLTPPLPTFDGRAVVYPAVRHIRDYLSWRQADCHINNLYNTTFHALVQQGGQTPQEAETSLAGTFSNDKNELLFSRFGINYNNEDAVWRKGSVVFRDFRNKEKHAGAKADVGIRGEQELESTESRKTGERGVDAAGSAESQSQSKESQAKPRSQSQPESHPQPQSHPSIDAPSTSASPEASPKIKKRNRRAGKKHKPARPKEPTAEPGSEAGPSNTQPANEPPPNSKAPSNSKVKGQASGAQTGPSSAPAATPARNTSASNKQSANKSKSPSNNKSLSDLQVKGQATGSQMGTSSAPVRNTSTSTSTKTSTSPQVDKPLSKNQLAKQRKRHAKAVITVEHVDIIRDAFWEERPWILGE